MCLMVHPQSNCCGNKNYLAIYVHIVSGRHDDQLVWPIPGEVKVEFLNQQHNDRHHARTMKWLETNECAKKPSAGGENEGFGFSLFISHSTLETVDSSSESDSKQSLYKPSCMYLKDDCLFFRVQKVSLLQSVCHGSSLPTEQKHSSFMYFSYVTIYNITQYILCCQYIHIHWYSIACAHAH